MATELLAKAPHERPGIDEVRERLGLRRSGALRPSASSLVGRDAELSLLRAKMGAALAGKPQLVLLEGESGIGKSALAEVFCRETDCLVLTGRCYEREALPFRALDSCMDELALHLRAWPQAELAPLADDIARASLVFAAFGVLLPKERRPGEAAEMSRADVFAALRRLVRAAQAHRPILFLIDDLQWTDPESIELIKALLAPPRSGRFLIVGLSRPVSDPSHPSWSLRELAQATHVPVRPLDDDAMRRVLEASAGVRGPGAYDAIIARSRGNPFFVQQVALALRAHPDLASSSALPSLSELVRLRCQDLGRDARAVLETASVLGTIARRRTLESADVEGSFQAALDEVLTSGLMSLAFAPDAAAGHRIAYDLSHDAIRENVYADLTPARRNGLHARLLASLEADPDATVDAKLRHAQAVGDAARVYRYASDAAAQAYRRFSYEHACDLYAAALRAAPADLAPSTRAELHLSLSQARHRINDYPGVKEHMSIALALLGVATPAGPWREALSTASLATRHIARRFTRARGEAPADVAIRLRAATALERLAEIHTTDNHPESAFHAIFQMIDLCESLPPSPELGRAFVLLSVGLKILGLRSPANGYRSRAAQLVERSDDAMAKAMVTLHGAMLDVSDGRWADAHTHFDAARAGFERAGADERALHAMALNLHVSMFEGKRDAALRDVIALEREATRLADHLRTTTAHLVHAELAARAGDVALARHHLASLPVGESHNILETMRLSATALVDAHDGRFADSVAAFDAAIVAIGGPIGQPFLGSSLALLAEATRLCGTPARHRAREIHRRLRIFSWSHPFVAATCSLQEAALERDPSRARRCLRAAIASAEAFGMHYELGRALEALSRLDPSDPHLAHRARTELALCGVPTPNL